MTVPPAVICKYSEQPLWDCPPNCAHERGGVVPQEQGSRSPNGAARGTARPPHNSPPAPVRAPLDYEAVSLADVERERVSWLWPGRVPLGKLTVLDGDPGLGKSTVLLDLAARVSTGRAMPDGTRPECGPSGVVLLSAEDGLGDTIRPRLEAADANLKRISALTSVTDVRWERRGDEEVEVRTDRPPTIADTAKIGVEARRIAARLIIVDPLMAYLPGEVNSFRDQDVRRALLPLTKLAEELGAAVVVLRHLNKAAGGNPLYRGGGSIGIIGAARSGLLVAKDPDDEGRRILAGVKSNLAPAAEALAYRLEGDETGTVRVVWCGASSHTAAGLLALPIEPEERSATDQAKEFLRSLLADGKAPVKEIRGEARAAGIADRTLDRAKNALRVAAEREGFGPGAAWYWSLPGPIERQERHSTPPSEDGALWEPWRPMGRTATPAGIVYSGRNHQLVAELRELAGALGWPELPIGRGQSLAGEQEWGRFLEAATDEQIIAALEAARLAREYPS